MQLPLKSKNIMFILIGIGLIFLAYVLMGTEDFIDAQAPGLSLALDISPIMIVVGHIVVAYGILVRTTDSSSSKDS